MSSSRQHLSALRLALAPIDGIDGEDDLGALLGFINEPGAFRQPEAIARPHDESAFLGPDGERAFKAIEIFVIEHRPFHGAVLEDGYSRTESLADVAGDVASNPDVTGAAADLLEIALFRSDQLDAVHPCLPVVPALATFRRPAQSGGRQSSSFRLAEATTDPRLGIHADDGEARRAAFPSELHDGRAEGGAALGGVEAAIV